MVLHRQPVGVSGVADVTVVLSDLVKVLVIGQAARVTVRLPAFLAGERSPSTFGRVEFLRPGRARGGVGLFEALVDVLHAHDLALGGLCSHGVQLRRTRLLEARSAGAAADQTFGPLLLVETEVVDQLFLDLEGLTAFFTLVPTTGMETKEKLLWR